MELLERLAAALGDRYRVERELGHGGMAVVFLAEDLKHRRRVAIKVLKPELSAVLGSERFLREIEIAATLQHPHILPLHDSGQADGLVYYVMPFVEGESLRQRLTREPQLPLDAALQIAREVGGALQHAHNHGVIHRDIKPENILLSGGHAVVADFGIARALDAAGAAHLTSTGMVVGTPQYMSPEQSGGGSIDARTDQYSLACTLYEMLIGQPPFTGVTPLAIAARHSLDPVPSLRVVRQTVPPTVESAIVTAMAKLPVDRFDSIQRFVDALTTPAPTTGETLATSTAQPAARSGRRGAPVVVTVGVVLLAAGGFWLWNRRSRPAEPMSPAKAEPAVTAVAVLPFQDLASGPDDSYLGEGMTEGLIADLAQIKSLKIISRTSGTEAKGRARSLAEMARDLGVEAVVNGTIRRSGDTVAVAIRFLRAADSSSLLTKEYHSRLGELPDLQKEITVAISQSISAKLAGTERSRLDLRQPVDQRAYEAFLRGRFHLDRTELDRAKAMFEQAGKIAPNWAPPYVGMANYYTTLPFATDVSPAEVLPKARAELVHALELDETLAEAHAVNAYVRAYYEWDWQAAEKEFQRAIELRPNYADAYFSYSRFLASRRRIKEAIAQIDRAVELDPLSPGLLANRALLDYFAGSYDSARTRLQEIVATDSTDITAKWGLAMVAEQQGKPNEAIAILEPISKTSLLRKASLGHAYAVAGKTGQAQAILTTLRAEAARRYVPSYYFALVHIGLSQKEQALRYLERAHEERSTVLAYLLIDPRLAPLHAEPRFTALSQQLGGQ